jgi:uncharacterized protein (DUF1697 family)
MSACIALLRAINLPGHNKVAMRDLLDLLAGLGLRDGQALLQTGNLVFRGGKAPAPELERLLEDAARQRLGLDTDIMVRTAQEWRAAVERNPFPVEARADPGHLLLVALKQAPAPGAEARLQSAITGREVVRVRGKHAYLVYPDGVGRSRLTSAVIDRHLGTRGTGRNWNTVLKLGALADRT